MARHSGMDRRDYFRTAGTGAVLAGVGVAAAGSATAAAPNAVDPHHPKTGTLWKEGEVLGIGIIGVGGRADRTWRTCWSAKKTGTVIIGIVFRDAVRTRGRELGRGACVPYDGGD